MITITEFKDYRGNKEDVIIFKDIEIYILLISYRCRCSVSLIGCSINGFKYYIHIHYLNSWRFRKQISKKLLYRLFDKKTVNDLYLEKTIALMTNRDILVNCNYVILRKQVIEL